MVFTFLRSLSFSRQRFFLLCGLLFFLLAPAVIYAGGLSWRDQVLAAMAPRLAIITTSDLQSNIYSRKISSDVSGVTTVKTIGGMDRIAALAQQVRLEVDGALLVSTGDDLMGAFYSVFAGTPEIVSMNMAGYDVVAPGNHEFDQGLSVYAEAAARAEFDILAANLDFGVSELAGIVKPYVFKSVAGIKVGLFGLMTPALKSVSNVGDEVTVDGDLVGVATEMVTFLRGQGARLVIALSHCGTILDRQVAANVAGLDLIVGGHSHECLYESVTNPEGKPCIIVQAGAGGSKVGVLKFSFLETLQTPQWELVELDEKVGSVASIKDYVDGYVEEFDLLLGEPIGETLVALDSRKVVIRQSESNLGNLITDAVAAWFSDDETDPSLVMISSGSIRGDRLYPAGKLSHKDVLSMLPFANTIMRVEMTGSQLLAVLEAGASALLVDGDACPGAERVASGGFLQLSSAFKVVIDPAQAPFCARYNGRDLEEIINPGNRIVEVEIFLDGFWQTLLPEANYTVYVNSWLAEGGDGHYVFTGLEKDDSTVLVADILARYIKLNSPVDPVVEGRIQIDGF
ncbi:MAG: bifunctional UDP-sugar hydrolase/5'-nucleotidase [Pseudomonadota bacterium]|nr:bifunctional UDP-sugar hydrolase/5'-nucleotidase [Pseudomonadota bacterium]